MYNGIGLQTARGSGTNGYVTKNFAILRRRDKVKTQDDFKDDPASRKPNQGILEHARKRNIEVKCTELADKLEEIGLSEDEIERQVDALRNVLQLDMLNEDAERKKTEVVKETHHIAEANLSKNSMLREAFGISEFFVEGSSLDPERREREAQAKAAARHPYDWVRTPSPSPENVECLAKKTENPSEKKKSKKMKKEKKKRKKSQLARKEEKLDKSKKKRKNKKRNRSESDSSESSESDDSSVVVSVKKEKKDRSSKKRNLEKKKRCKSPQKLKKVSESESSESSDSDNDCTSRKIKKGKKDKSFKKQKLEEKEKYKTTKTKHTEDVEKAIEDVATFEKVKTEASTSASKTLAESSAKKKCQNVEKKVEKVKGSRVVQSASDGEIADDDSSSDNDKSKSSIKRKRKISLTMDRKKKSKSDDKTKGDESSSLTPEVPARFEWNIKSRDELNERKSSVDNDDGDVVDVWDIVDEKTVRKVRQMKKKKHDYKN